MKKAYSILMITICLLSFNITKAQNVIITGVFDGPLPGGIPKLLELYVINNVADMSIYGVSSVTNGQGTTGIPEFTFPTVSAAAGQFVYIATDSASVFTYFGIYPNYTNNFMSVNGDDAVELFLNGAVTDVFGDVNCDPNSAGTTCPGWEYLDGWGYRNDGAGTGTSTFSDTDWTFSGANATDACSDNTSCVSQFPIGTYQAVSTPTLNIETPSFTMNEGDPATNVTRFIINPPASSAGSYEIHLKSGNGSAADLDLTGFGGGPFPLTLPIQAGDDTLNVPITPNDDAVYEGTETFNFVLRNVMGGVVLGTDTNFTLTMTDNELPPDTVVNFNPATATASEGSGTVGLTLEIGQLSAHGTTFTVDVELTTGDAADINNYITQTVSFPSTGTTTQILTLNITDDMLVEGNETLTFTLTNPSTGLTLGANTTTTLTLTDNDAPTYTIADLTTVNANGEPDSMGVAVELDAVVMGINYGDMPNINFYIYDGTGGMGVFNTDNFGYTVNEGDQVTIKGEVGFFNGLTQLVNLDTIFVTGAGTLPTVATVTNLSETTEGELVKLENVTVVDQSDWNTGVGAGFNVDVTDGTNNYSIRIDKSADLFNMSIPGCVIDVTGIGSQFDNTTPYTSGYQLLPRYAADITVIDTCATVPSSNFPLYDIATVTGINADGVADSLSVECRLRGVVISTNFNTVGKLTFYIHDGTGGIGLFASASDYGYQVAIGDKVEVTGNIGQFRGLTQMYLDTVIKIETDVIPTPTEVTTLNENTEAELITIKGLTLQAGSTWPSSGMEGNVIAKDATNNTYTIHVDKDTDVDGGTYPNTFNIVGVGSQFTTSTTAPFVGGYQILPRMKADITGAVRIKEINLNNFVISPVPAIDILNIAFDFDINENTSIQLINVLGKVVASQSVNLVKGYNKTIINVANLNAGFYVLQIQTSKGVSNTNVLIK